MSERYYKVLGPDRMPYHGGYGQWPEVGVWRKTRGKLKPGSNGLHYCTLRQLPDWLGPHIWGFEPDGDVVIDDDKCVAGRGRLTHEYTTWTDRTARLFAADCAEHVLSLFETRYPDDLRPRQAIDAARGYATGDVSRDRLRAAANAALSAAAWSANAEAIAARSAARSAATLSAAVWSANAAANVAWSANAVADVAANAARSAAAADASAAERNWQAERLRQYLDGEVGSETLG